VNHASWWSPKVSPELVTCRVKPKNAQFAKDSAEFNAALLKKPHKDAKHSGEGTMKKNHMKQFCMI
jgi:hypothetical protein